MADSHAINVLSGRHRRPMQPLPELFHCPPEPFATPAIDAKSGLFYIGINWERIGRPKGRFHDTLVALDAKGLTRIYGPELISGVAPWAGFATYQGELPFDGRSVLEAINEAGICLALSSAQHKNSGVMSNRLFEGLAGGAAVIATPHPLIDKLFGGVVYQVDDSRGDDHLTQQIIAAMRDIRNDPQEAIRRTLRGQDILRSRCIPEKSLLSLFAGNAARVADYEEQTCADASVTVVLIHTHGSPKALAEQIGDLQQQQRARIVLHVICDRHFDVHAADLRGLIHGAVEDVQFHASVFSRVPTTFEGASAQRTAIGPTVLAILSSLTTELFAFLVPDEHLFREHFATLAKAMADDPAAVAACSGLIVEHQDGAGHRNRILAETQFVDTRSAAYVDGPAHRGRFVYAARLVTPHLSSLFELLDGEEHRFFRARAAASGGIAQSAHATYVAGPGAAAAGWETAPSSVQQQFIRDRLALDPTWLAMIARLAQDGSIPSSVFAYAPGAPVRWTDQRAPVWVRQLLAPHVRYETRAGGNGVGYLVSGFSWPESAHVWLAAEKATIEFALPPATRARQDDLEIVMTVAGRRSLANGREQHATFAINDVTVAYLRVPDHEADIRLPIPKGLLRGDGLYSVQVTPDHADLVYDAAGAVIDNRHLSIMFTAISVQTRLINAVPAVVVDRTYACGAGGTGLPMLARGFFPPEAGYSWIAGNRGIMRFSVRERVKQPVLMLSLADPHVHRRVPNDVRVLVDDHEILITHPARSATEVPIRLSGELAAGAEVAVTIEVAHAGPLMDASGEVFDGRNIGVAVHGFRLMGKRATWSRRLKRRAARLLRKVRGS